MNGSMLCGGSNGWQSVTMPEIFLRLNIPLLAAFPVPDSIHPVASACTGMLMQAMPGA
jgi:hypothetical protein